MDATSTSGKVAAVVSDNDSDDESSSPTLMDLSSPMYKKVKQILTKDIDTTKVRARLPVEADSKDWHFAVVGIKDGWVEKLTRQKHPAVVDTNGNIRPDPRIDAAMSRKSSSSVWC